MREAAVVPDGEWNEPPVLSAVHAARLRGTNDAGSQRRASGAGQPTPTRSGSRIGVCALELSAVAGRRRRARGVSASARGSVNRSRSSEERRNPSYFLGIGPRQRRVTCVRTAIRSTVQRQQAVLTRYDASRQRRSGAHQVAEGNGILIARIRAKRE